MKRLLYRNSAIIVSNVLVFAAFSVTAIAADSTAVHLSGRILLQVESHGEAWYVNPINGQRHFLGRPQDAFNLMRTQGIGITNTDLARIPEAGSTSTLPTDLNRLKGHFLLQVQSHGEAWYVSPTTGKRYSLGRPQDAFNIMRGQGLGISNNDLARIPLPSSTLQPTTTTPRVDKIKIMAPANGTVVAPGQHLTVSVQVAPGSAYTAVQVIGENIGITTPLVRPPYEFTLTVPNNIIGPKKITALGITGPGMGDFSQSVAVDVETSVSIVALEIDPPRLSFRFPGDQLNLLVMGKFSDGTGADVTASSHATYKSNNTGVATVDGRGVVTAVGVGTAGINVRYGTQSVSVPVAVPQTVNGDLNGDGVVDQDDVNIILDYLNSPANGPADARDRNHDGVIDILDAQQLATLCSTLCTVPAALRGNVIN